MYEYNHRNTDHLIYHPEVAHCIIPMRTGLKCVKLILKFYSIKLPCDKKYTYVVGHRSKILFNITVPYHHLYFQSLVD